MEALSLILGALVAGASDVTKAAVKDGYEFLKTKLLQKVSKPEVTQAIAQLDQDPHSSVNQQLVEAQLSGCDILQDEEIIALSKGLLAKVEQSKNKFNINISGGQVGAIGDHANITFN